MKETLICSQAKSQLGLSPLAPDSTVPMFYIEEFKSHVAVCPNDNNFRVKLEPNHGFGTVTCLERGCDGIVIQLTARSGVTDGGKSDGLGSFQMYRRHSYSHPTHKAARDERVKVEPVGTQNKVEKRSVVTRGESSLLKALDTNTPSTLRPSKLGPPITSSGQLATRRISSLTRVKLDLKASSVVLEPSKVEPAKVEKERVPEAPPVNATLTAQPNTAVSLREPSLLSNSTLTATREKYKALVRKVSITKNEINRLLLKQDKTDSDRRRMEELQHAMRIDEGLMQHLNSLVDSIMSVDPFRPTTSDPFMDIDYTNTTALSEHFGGASAQANSSVPVLSISLPSPEAMMISPTDYDDISYVFGQVPDDALAQSMLQQIGAPIIAPSADAYHYDENGNFHGRDRDRITGPRANPKDMDQFLDTACTEQFDGNATVEEALTKLGLKTQYDLLPGMAVPLMPHQTIGVAWMIDKEASKLKGGALSDEMGLGKTVQMIAVMVKNRSKDPLCKTNLIIAPPALLEQWRLEIELKTNNALSCIIYHGPNRLKRKEELLKYDVVLTTFGTMSTEWFDAEKDGKKLEQLHMQRRRKGSQFVESDSDDEHEYTAKKRKPNSRILFDVEFYRIILDEAQNIRNRKTRMSRAVLELQATYRWCLTGTPIINSLSDVYPYLRFIRVSPWHDFTEFQQHIGRIEKNRPSLAVCRLQAIIVTFLLRRMKDSKLDGKRLIELPEKNVGLIQLEFSPEERDIYRMVEIRSQAKFNKFLNAGTVLKNYHQVLVLLLRLRQICSHASLITEDGSAFVMPGEADETQGNDLARACKLVSPEFVEKVKIKLREAALNRVKAEKESVDATIEDDECPICFDIRNDSIITPCTHMFCRECITDVLNTPQPESSEEHVKYRGDERPCPVCRSPISKDKLFSRAAFESAINGNDVKSEKMDEDVDDVSDFVVPDNDDEGYTHRQKRLFHQRQDGEGIEKSEATLTEKANKAFKAMPRFLPSAKMKYMMEAVKKILKEKPDEKVLVISQWTSCLSLVSDYLNEFEIDHVKYQGDMRRSERDRAIREFMTGMDSRVMLMSLKCGGVGLNLTRANNVILLDLAWSPAIEAQAFDRVHRLGQTRHVHVEKLVISNTVEDRILQLQLRKQQLADGSLGEGSGKKIGRLSVRELANLFGLDVRGRRITEYD